MPYELYHHGILGMRWGKRNGPPYPLSAKAHSKSEKDAGWRKSLDKGNSKEKKPSRVVNALARNYSKNYEEIKGYSHEDAKEAGKRKAEIMKRVAIGAGVVVGVSAAAYIYRQYGMNYADGIIKAGETIQTLSTDPNRMETGEAFFTAFRDGDKYTYEALFGKNQPVDLFGFPTGPAENKQIIQAFVDKNIKIAGGNTGNKVFQKLMSTDSDFRTKVTEYLNDPQIQLMKLNMGFLGMNVPDYHVFNTFALLDEHQGELQKKFYDELKKLGYGAVADINDRKYSGYNTAAVLVFDRKNLERELSGALKTKVSTLTDGQINVAQGKYAWKSMVEFLQSPTAALIGGGASINIASNIADKKNDKKYGNKNQNGRG